MKKAAESVSSFRTRRPYFDGNRNKQLAPWFQNLERKIYKLFCFRIRQMLAHFQTCENIDGFRGDRRRIRYHSVPVELCPVGLRVIAD